MAIQNDFTVYPYSKVIRYTGSNDNVYECSVFYSYLQNLFDEPGYLSYENPIKYNTPTSYSMQNKWFLDDGDGSNILQHLTGGSIDTSGYTDYVLMVDADGMSGTNFIASDKDKTIVETGNVGPLLAYKNTYPVANSARFWVRDTNTHGVIHNNDAFTTSSGQGAGLADGDSITGDEIYANVYTIASYAGSPNPQVYIRQNHPSTDAFNTRVTEWSNADNWDRGSTTTEEIDVLIPVKLGGTAIDSGNITLYARQTGDSFSHYTTALGTTGASRTPIAVETSADTVNITTGEHYLLFDGSDAGSFSVGDVIQNVSTASTTPPSWYAEVTAVTFFAGNATGVLTLRGLRGTITDDADIYVDTVVEGVANGTPGGTYTLSSAISVQLTVGLTCTGGTSGAKRVLKGADDTAKAYVFAVDETISGSAKDVYYKDFTASETITDTTTGTVTHQATTSTSITSDHTDVTIAHVNGTIVVDTFSGTFEIGEKVTWTGGGPAIMCKTNGSTEMTLGNVVDETALNTSLLVITGASSGATCQTNGTGGMTDAYKEGYEFPLQSTGAEYAVCIEGGDVYRTVAGLGRTMEQIYAYIQYRCRDGLATTFYTSTGSAVVQIQGQFYIRAYSTYAISKVAPFGTLAGGVFFGAQGVWLQGMASADANSLKLVPDAGGDPLEPYTSITVMVSNTRIGDVIMVAKESGSTGLPDKAQFTCAAGQAQSASTLNKSVGSNFPNDTPSNGWVYVVDTSANQEHKYRFVSWSGEQLALMTEVTGTAEGGTSGQTLFDTGVFTAAAVQRGDIIRRTTDHAWCYIISRDNDNQVTTTVLSNGTAWAEGDTFEVGSLVVSYDGSDTFYIPYLEGIEDEGTDETPGTESNLLTYVSNRAVVVRVRNVIGSTPIQPFVTTNDILITGMNQAVIRTEDEVYS